MKRVTILSRDMTTERQSMIGSSDYLSRIIFFGEEVALPKMDVFELSKMSVQNVNRS